ALRYIREVQIRGTRYKLIGVELIETEKRVVGSSAEGTGHDLSGGWGLGNITAAGWDEVQPHLRGLVGVIQSEDMANLMQCNAANVFKVSSATPGKSVTGSARDKVDRAPLPKDLPDFIFEHRVGKSCRKIRSEAIGD